MNAANVGTIAYQVLQRSNVRENYSLSGLLVRENTIPACMLQQVLCERRSILDEFGPYRALSLYILHNSEAISTIVAVLPPQARASIQLYKYIYFLLYQGNILLVPIWMLFQEGNVLALRNLCM